MQQTTTWLRRYKEELEAYGIPDFPAYLKHALKLAKDFKNWRLTPGQAAAVAQKCHEEYCRGCEEWV